MCVSPIASPSLSDSGYPHRVGGTGGHGDVVSSPPAPLGSHRVNEECASDAESGANGNVWKLAKDEGPECGIFLESNHYHPGLLRERVGLFCIFYIFTQGKVPLSLDLS